MKSLFCKVGLRLLVLQLVLLLCQTGSAAVGFTVTPAAVSNTYSGTVTLQVIGLPSGDTVVVQKFLDANTNGVIDGGDLLVQQFSMTDGQAGMVIGGVTNINVPGDADTIAGQITAPLNFQNGDFAQTMIGKYLYKLSSPAGHFAALTNLFTVTNFPYGQKFTGNVVSNGTGTTVPNATLLLFPPPRSGHGHDLGQPLAGVVADNSGSYTIDVPAGTYSLLAFKSNYVFSTAPVLTLGGGATVTTNLTLTSATAGISGAIVDAANNSIGLPGVFSGSTSTNNFIAIVFTDTNGNFTERVTPGQWSIGANEGLIVHGYVELNNSANFNSGATGVIVPYQKATALFYGSVKDSFGNPLSGVAIEAFDNNSQVYDSDGYTGTNGNYVTVAVGGLGGNDLWEVNVDHASSFPNYIFSQPAFNQNGGASINVGQAVQANITAILATNHITGNVQYNGSALTGVAVSAYATINGVNYNLNTVDTDSNGNYSLNVANGNWSVFVSCQGGNDSLDGILGNGNYQCPNNENVTINNSDGGANFTVSAGGSYQITGAILDSVGNPVIGVNVYADDGNGDNLTTTTDGGGNYSFNVGNGNWDVSVDCGGLSALGDQCVSDQQVNISNGNYNGLDFTVQRCGSLGVSTSSSLPDGLVGAFFSTQLLNSGCNSPFTWSLTPGSLPLPPGLMLSNSGAIYGTPTTVGTNYFSVRVTDGMTNTADQLLQLNVYPALQMTPGTLPNGTIGVFYNTQVLVSGGVLSQINGIVGYSINVFNGSFPPGVNFSYGASTGSNMFIVISGTPTNSGGFPFTISATDADGNEVQSNYSITIASSSLQITTTSLANTVAGVSYSYQLQASGGMAPYTWSIAQGSQQLPSGLAISTGGLISGVPGTNGTFNFIVRLTDANSITTTRSFSLVINAGAAQPALSSPVWLSGQFQMRLTGLAGQNYTLQTSTNLSSTSWLSLYVTNNALTNSFLLTDPNATNNLRFYRLLIGP